MGAVMTWPGLLMHSRCVEQENYEAARNGNNCTCSVTNS